MHVFTLSFFTTVRIVKLNKKSAANSAHGTVGTREKLLTTAKYKSGGFPLHQSALCVNTDKEGKVVSVTKPHCMIRLR